VFEPNQGQTDSKVRFLAQGPASTLFLTSTDAVLTLARPLAHPGDPQIRDGVSLQFVGTNPSAWAEGQDLLPSRSNYFTGTDRTKWLPNVPNYAKVTYHGLYPGVDVTYYGNAAHQLEYDVVVAPGADYHAVQLNLLGTTSTLLDGHGNLLLNTAGGQLVSQAPVLYQVINGTRQAVTGRYTLTAGGRAGFGVDAYDQTKPLYIDPVLLYSVTLAGSLPDYGQAIAVDGEGEAFVTGYTRSGNFPTQYPYQTSLAGGSDAFVTKLDASGGLIYSTYLGGGSDDQGLGIAVDAAGSAYVTGSTLSTDFPTTPGAFQRTNPHYLMQPAGFVTKLNATGDALLYSTFLDGQHCGTQANAIAVDASGDAFVTGLVYGTDFPTTPGAFQTASADGADAFVTELNPGGSGLVYSTYLGGSGSSEEFGGTDKGLGIAVDSQGEAYVTGWTAATTFPVRNAYQATKAVSPVAAFVTKLNSAGTGLIFSTYLGGKVDDNSADGGNAIALDSSGNAYVTGEAYSDFPTTANAYQTTNNAAAGPDAFLTKLTPAGGLAYSTFFGGSSSAYGNGVAVDSYGVATVTGLTDSSDFPVRNPLVNQGYPGGSSAFLTQFNPALSGDASLLYSTYLNSGYTGNGIAEDLQGTAYVVGTANAAYPDAFVAKIALLGPPAISAIDPPTADTGLSSSDQITNARTFGLKGTAPPGSVVTVSRADYGVVGTAPPTDSNGNWTLSSAASNLDEGTYTFTATDSLAGHTSTVSPPFPVTVDLTAPTLQVTVLARPPVTTLAPQVRVTAQDNVALPNDTDQSAYQVFVDVDQTNSGTFTPNASAVLHNGTATLTLSLTAQASFPMTFPIRAHVLDVAGNQGLSTVQNIVVYGVVNPWQIGTQILTADPFDGQGREQLGNVHVEHALDLDQSPGTTPGGNPRLVYNSDTVSVQPVVQVTIPTDNAPGVLLPPSVTAQVTWNLNLPPAQQQTFTYGPMGISSPPAAPGDVLTLALPIPAGNVTATGRYPWSVQVTMNYVGNPITRTLTNSSYLVDQDNSVLGAGWTFAPVDQLIPIPQDSYGPAGQLRVYGTGEWRFFPRNADGSYQSPPGDNGTLVSSGGTFLYTYPDGRTDRFSGTGLMTSTTSADGKEVLSFSTGAANAVYALTAIDGTPTTFTYGSGQVTIVTANARTTTLALSAAGPPYNLTQITNPDGGLHTFTYDSSHHPTGDTFGLLQDGWAYATGELTAST
jgi:YD repeat-containing protein